VASHEGMIIWTLWIDNNDWEFQISWLKENWKFSISFGFIQDYCSKAWEGTKRGVAKAHEKKRCSSMSWINNGVRKDWHIIWNLKVTKKCRIRYSTWHYAPPTPPLNFTRLLISCYDVLHKTIRSIGSPISHMIWTHQWKQIRCN
jgi:hypothetical protein